MTNPVNVPKAPKVDQEPVAWRDPTNFNPDQSVTFDRADRDKWPHIYCQALYTHPAPASDELLEALRGIIDRSEEVRDMLASHPAMQGREHMSMGIAFNDAIGRAQRAYVAKHKGPQS